MGTTKRIELIWKGTISGALYRRSISAAWFCLAFSLSLSLIILIPVSSSAHGLAGKRFFPTTLAIGNHVGFENSHHEHYAGAETEPVVHLETSPSDISVGTPVKMTVHIEDRNGKPVEGLTVHHERILHAIIIGKDLNVFAHMHPEDIGPVNDEMLRKTTFPFRFTFPKAGEYLVGLDFATTDGLYSKMSYIKVVGYPVMGEPKIDFSTEKDFGEYHVTLKTSPEIIKAGKETIFRYLIKKNVKPVTDFEPYLGAPMHLAVVLADLKQFIHTHGIIPGEPHTAPGHMHAESAERFGPEIDAVIVFPVKGTYKIFSQMKHQGKVILFDFVVNVQ
ncbi:MAG: hypothetical protein ABIB41_01400 [Nitrospirota bacterium]